MDTDKGMQEKALARLYENVVSLPQKLAANMNYFKSVTSMAVNDEKGYESSGDVSFKGRVLAFVDTIYAKNYNLLLHGLTMTDQRSAIYDLNVPDAGLDLSQKVYSFRELERIVDSFDKSYWLPFKMYVSGYEYEEIASRMKLPVGTVKSRIFFVHRRLHEVMENGGK